MGELIPIIAIISTFGGAVLIVGLIVYAIIRRNRMRHEERMEMIKSGKEIPVEWEYVSKPKGRAFFWGVIITGFGAGLQILQGFEFIADLFRGRLYVRHDSGDYFAGFIFLGVGIALIWYHNYQKKQGVTNGSQIPLEPQKKEDTHVQQQ